MTSSSPDSAADLVRLEPESLARWHQLVSAGFEQNNPSQVHHGITGSLILDCAHPVTIYQIKLAFQKLPLESYWQYLILRTLQTYGQPILHDLLPIWSDLRLLDQPTPPSWPVQQASRPPALDGLLLRRDLEEVVAVLSTYSLTNGNDTDPCWFPSLLESTLAAEAFGPGKIHTLTVSAHKCLVSLLVKYKVSLRCKVFVDVEGTDVLRIFLEQLKPHCIPVNEATLRWVCLCLEILDPNQKNDYYCAFLLAACFCALVSGDTPESRSTLLTRAVGDDISQFNATPLLRRFFLRAAPPSLARQFLARTTKSDPEHSTATDAYSKTKTTAKYIAASEMAFHLSSFEPPTTSAEAVDFKAIYPCLQNIDVSELREARSHYISGSAFAVSIFGQLRHSSFRALRNSLQFCGSEAERRCPFVSVSSWSQTAPARYPKVSGELPPLFADARAGALSLELAKQVSVDRIFEVLLRHHRLEANTKSLREALDELCPELSSLRVQELNEKLVEQNFARLYPLSTEEHGEAIPKILLNQYKMWNTIAASLDGYVKSGRQEPLILHRVDVSTENVFKLIEESQIFAKEDVAFLTDSGIGSFIVTPIGGMGDRFWVISSGVARALHKILQNLHSAPLVDFVSSWPSQPTASPLERAHLMIEHRLCDVFSTLFSPSLFASPAGPAQIENDALFKISHDDLLRLANDQFSWQVPV